MQYFKVYWRQWECGQLVFVPNSCIIYKLLFSKGHLEIDKAKCVFAVTVHSEYLWIHCKKDAHFSFLQRFMGILCASPCESVCIFREWHLNHSGFDFSFCMSIKPSSHTWLFSHSFIPYNFYTYLNIHLQIHYSSIHSHTHTCAWLDSHWLPEPQAVGCYYPSCISSLSQPSIQAFISSLLAMHSDAYAFDSVQRNNSASEEMCYDTHFQIINPFATQHQHRFHPD